MSALCLTSSVQIWPEYIVIGLTDTDIFVLLLTALSRWERTSFFAVIALIFGSLFYLIIQF